MSFLKNILNAVMAGPSAVETVSIAELHERFKKLRASEVILDVRDPDEFQQGHIPGALNIPASQVLSQAEKLKKYERVYMYCHGGPRAVMAFGALKKAGVNNLMCVSSSGMGGWIRAGYEVER